MIEFTNPVIAAVRSDEEYLKAINSPVLAIFMLKADILTLENLLKQKNGKKIFVHIDMAEGVGRDKKGLMLLKEYGVDGIISTKNSLIIMARELGLYSVQRFFIIDSLSVQTALDIIKNTKPAYVEILPGVIPKAVKSFVENASMPIIAGGLIEEKNEVLNALSTGATAVSTGKENLWET